MLTQILDQWENLIQLSSERQSWQNRWDQTQSDFQGALRQLPGNEGERLRRLLIAALPADSMVIEYLSTHEAEKSAMARSQNSLPEDLLADVLGQQVRTAESIVVPIDGIESELNLAFQASVVETDAAPVPAVDIDQLLSATSGEIDVEVAVPEVAVPEVAVPEVAVPEAVNLEEPSELAKEETVSSADTEGVVGEESVARLENTAVSCATSENDVASGGICDEQQQDVGNLTSECFEAVDSDNAVDQASTEMCSETGAESRADASDWESDVELVGKGSFTSQFEEPCAENTQTADEVPQPAEASNLETEEPTTAKAEEGGVFDADTALEEIVSDPAEAVAAEAKDETLVSEAIEEQPETMMGDEAEVPCEASEIAVTEESELAAEETVAEETAAEETAPEETVAEVTVAEETAAEETVAEEVATEAAIAEDLSVPQEELASSTKGVEKVAVEIEVSVKVEEPAASVDENVAPSDSLMSAEEEEAMLAAEFAAAVAAETGASGPDAQEPDAQEPEAQEPEAEVPALVADEVAADSQVEARDVDPATSDAHDDEPAFSADLEMEASFQDLLGGSSSEKVPKAKSAASSNESLPAGPLVADELAASGVNEEVDIELPPSEEATTSESTSIAAEATAVVSPGLTVPEESAEEVMAKELAELREWAIQAIGPDGIEENELFKSLRSARKAALSQDLVHMLKVDPKFGREHQRVVLTD